MLSVLKWTRRTIWFGNVILFLYLMVVGQYYIFFAYRNPIVTDVRSGDDKVTIIGVQFPNAKEIHEVYTWKTDVDIKVGDTYHPNILLKWKYDPDNKGIHILVAFLFNVVIIVSIIAFLMLIIVSIINGTFEEYIKDRREYYD